jgi:gas vesicle protein
MRLGKYEASEGSGVSTAITFLLIGLGAGALTALLLAPKGGKQMRRDLRKKYESARETLDDWTEEARDKAEEVMDRGSEIADELRDRVKPIAKAMRRS